VTAEDCGNPVLEKCGAKMDLAIVMDSSSSIGQVNWMQMKDFVKTLVGAFTLDRDDGAAISVFRYNEVVDTNTQILMKHHPSDKDAFFSYLNAIPYNGQGTKTGKAINHVTDVILARGNGNRPDVRDVVVIITDGNAQDNVAAPARRLRATGAQVYVVPIKFGGQLDMEQIRSMVDDEGFIFTDAIEGGFEALDSVFAAQVTLRICNEPNEPPPNPCAREPCGQNGVCMAIGPITYTCDCKPGYEFRGGTCVEINPCDPNPCGVGVCEKSGPFKYSCNCPEGFVFEKGTCVELRCPVLNELLYGEKSCSGKETKQGTVCTHTCTEENYSLHPKNQKELQCQTDGTWDKEQPCCARPCPDFAVMDLVVVMDSSSSVKSSNWALMKNFVRTLLSGFSVAPDLAFLSVFRYNGKVDQKTQIFLRDFPENQQELLAKFDKIPYNGSGTKTGQAIDHVTDVMLAPKNGNRKQVQDIVLIITDGASQDDVKAPSQRLRDTGAQVLVLPIKSGGRLDKQQILDMAGPGNEKNIFWEAVEGGFEALDENFASQVTAGVCKDPCKSVFTEDDINEIIANFKNKFQ